MPERTAGLRPGPPPVVDAMGFRALMASFPSGVAVVTVLGPHDEPLGLTCSSLCSLSLDPPMLLVCIHKASPTLPAIRARRVFAVNLLHAAGQEAAETFASRPARSRFALIPWRPSPRWALPLLAEHAHTVTECRLDRTIPAGDHTIVIGEVTGILALSPGTAPLLYGMRRYAEWPG